MILVFGGTTEGRKAVAELEEAGSTFYYSTKTGEQDITLQHGMRVDGAMDADAMMRFCQKHDVGLIVDAAHPFAQRLHETVAEVTAQLHLPAIRFERIFPERDPTITWLNDYKGLPALLLPSSSSSPSSACAATMLQPRPLTLLATTGVQSIAKLKPLEAQGVKVLYRILPRESSLSLAYQQGATNQSLCFYREGEDEHTFLQTLRPDAILLKESGTTGGFPEKVAAAKALGIRIFALKKPDTPTIFHRVNGEHGLRLMVERLLPDFFPLHSGLTTGTCATAAAIAAAMRLLKDETPSEVPVLLPNGETIPVPVGYSPSPLASVGFPDGTPPYAYCIKHAGDDPDVTDGIEIRATVTQAPHFSIHGGTGVGTFTLPGFDYPPGSPAINKAPRAMIEENLRPFGMPMKVTISVPQGEAIAQKTFNPRLGITGGISIIGVSGIVKPFSEEAFIESIHKCMTVAKASEAERVVIHSGAKSAQALRTFYPHLPSQAFVEYGNAIGSTLQIANELNIKHLTLGIMLGKAVKLAEGHLDTHSKKVTMNKAFIATLLEEANCHAETQAKAANITLARELWDIIPQASLETFCHTVIRHCQQHCAPLLPNGELTILLIDDNGNVHAA